MIRFHVIRASRLLLTLAIVLLAAVVAVACIRYFSAQAAPTGAFPRSDSLAQTQTGEAAAAFAAAASVTAAPDENEHTDESISGFTIEILPRTSQKPEETPRGGTVLIYHTHTHEAYQQETNDPYQETEPWRTADPGHSIVHVGDYLTELLTARGLTVTHDTTDHEPPRLGTAYERSLKTLEGYAGKDFDLMIDLHRDAYSEELIGARAVLLNGKEAAQLMLLIGNGEEFTVKPNYEHNLAFAQRLTDRLNTLAPGICRNVLVKTGRYNQHMGKTNVLIEVGHNLNTLSEALLSMPVLAEAIAGELSGEEK